MFQVVEKEICTSMLLHWIAYTCSPPHVFCKHKGIRWLKTSRDMLHDCMYYTCSCSTKINVEQTPVRLSCTNASRDLYIRHRQVVMHQTLINNTNASGDMQPVAMYSFSTKCK